RQHVGPGLEQHRGLRRAQSRRRSGRSGPHRDSQGAPRHPGPDGAHGGAVLHLARLRFAAAHVLGAVLVLPAAGPRRRMPRQRLCHAPDHVAFLPLGLTIDKWRWEVFAGKVTPAEYTKRWWELRGSYGGVMPPLPRGAGDFDPGAKYHVAGNVPYMRYFLAQI